MKGGGLPKTMFKCYYFSSFNSTPLSGSFIYRPTGRSKWLLALPLHSHICYKMSHYR